MLNFKIHNLGEIALFECEGRLTVESANALRRAVITQAGMSNVVLDLKDLTDVDAAGLGAIASLGNWARSTGVSLKLMNLMPRVERLLELTGLRTEFDICSAREELELWCRVLRHEFHPATAQVKRAVGL
ncbi:MAG TPA: STAS domain-containing protein [Terriglobales bacterium]|nr:STAS domain-containing protein [Terriglobales bacterium]